MGQYDLPMPPINARVTKVRRGPVDVFVGNMPAFRGQRISESFVPGFTEEVLNEETELFETVFHDAAIEREMSTELAVPIPFPLLVPPPSEGPPDVPPVLPDVEVPEGAGGYVAAVLGLEPDCYWRFGEDSLTDHSAAGKLTVEDLSGNGHTGIVRVDRTEKFRYDPADYELPSGEYDTQGLTTPWLNATEGPTLDNDGCLDMGDHRFPGESDEENFAVFDPDGTVGFERGSNPRRIRHAWNHRGGPWDVFVGPEYQFVGDVAAHDPHHGQGAPYREDGFYPIEPGGDLTVMGFAFRDNLDKPHTLCHGQGLDVTFEPSSHVMTIFPPGLSVPLPLPNNDPFKPLIEQAWRRWFHFAITIHYPELFEEDPEAGKTTLYINGRKVIEQTFSRLESSLEPGGGDIRTGARGNGHLKPFFDVHGHRWPRNTEDLTPDECYRINKGVTFPYTGAEYDPAPDRLLGGTDSDGNPGPDGNYPYWLDPPIYPHFFTNYSWVAGYSDDPIPGEILSLPYSSGDGTDKFAEVNARFPDWDTIHGGPPEISQGMGTYEILPYPIGGWTARIFDWPDYAACREQGFSGTTTPPFVNAYWDFDADAFIPGPERDGLGLPWWDIRHVLKGLPGTAQPWQSVTPRLAAQCYGAYVVSDNQIGFGNAGGITPWRKKYLPGDSRQYPTGDDFGWPIRVGAGWNGLIDEWTVWGNRILTAAEIANAFAASKIPGEGYVPPDEEILPPPPESGADPFGIPTLLPGDAVTVIKGSDVQTVYVDVVEDRSDAGYVRAIATDTAPPLPTAASP